MTKGKIFAFIFFIFCLAICFSLVLFVITTITGTSAVSLDTAMLNSYNAKLTILDDNDNIITKTSGRGQNAISLKDLNDYTINAFIAVEDQTFYKHNGLNYGRIIKASLKNLFSGYAKEGASTITQQLIKNTHLTTEKTLKRKIKEAYLSLQLEKSYSKNEILSTYLNILYFGNNIFGLQDASKYYFGKNATELNIAESATLAGIIKAPSHYSPNGNLNNCLNRQKLVLKLMHEQKLISDEDYNLAKNTSLKFANQQNLVESLYNKMAVLEASNILGLSENSIYKNGIKLYTFFDNDIQHLVFDAYQNLHNKTPTQESCILVQDNTSNNIIACVGTNANYKRQCGSLIKPILCYASAFENNLLSPASQILDEKLNGDYSPKNVNNKYYGWISVREALSQSLNVPAVKTLEYVGIQKAKNFAQNFGVEFSQNDNHLALALGAMENGTTIQQISDAYAVFGNLGKYKKSTFIKKIVDQTGKIIYQNNNSTIKVCRDDTAFLINDILLDCSKKGTAKKIGTLDLEIASKTGTVGAKDGTNSDAWCVSYSPNLTITTWCGNVSGNKETNLLQSQNGGTICANANYDILKSMGKYINMLNFSKPNSITKLPLNTEMLTNEHKVILSNNKDTDIKEYFSIFNLPKEENIISFNNCPNLDFDTKTNQLIWLNNKDYTYILEIENDKNKKENIKFEKSDNEKCCYTIKPDSIKKACLYQTDKSDKVTKSNTIEFYINNKEKTLLKQLPKIWFG